MPETITASAPGKLFIAGEYAVVEPGQPAILVALDRYLTVRVTPGEGSRGAAVARPRDYLTAAISVMENLRTDRGKPAQEYRVRTTSELTRGGRKLGLGSSGAVTVAGIAALAQLYDLDLTPMERYRLALCATIALSPRASGGDVAASTYGGWIRYTSPDRTRIAESLSRQGIGRTIADDDVWQGATIEPVPALPAPLLVGWTAAPADTDTLVAAARSQEGYPEFLQDSATVVQGVLAARDASSLFTAVAAGRAVLARFAQGRGIIIETPALRALCDAAERHGGAGKTSGAGGGDCGIAFAPEPVHEQILEEWRTSGILPLEVSPHPREGDPQ